MQQPDNAAPPPQPTVEDRIPELDENYEAELNEQLAANDRVVSNMRYDGALGGAAVAGVNFGYQVANNSVSSGVIAGGIGGLFGGLFGSVAGTIYRFGSGDNSLADASLTAHFSAQVQGMLSGMVSGGFTYGTALVAIRFGATKEQAQWLAPVVVAGGVIGLKHGKVAVSTAASGIYKMGQYCCGFLTRRNQPSEAQRPLVPAAAASTPPRLN